MENLTTKRTGLTDRDPRRQGGDSLTSRPRAASEIPTTRVLGLNSIGPSVRADVERQAASFQHDYEEPSTAVMHHDTELTNGSVHALSYHIAQYPIQQLVMPLLSLSLSLSGLCAVSMQ